LRFFGMLESDRCGVSGCSKSSVYLSRRRLSWAAPHTSDREQLSAWSRSPSAIDDCDARRASASSLRVERSKKPKCSPLLVRPLARMLRAEGTAPAELIARFGAIEATVDRVPMALLQVAIGELVATTDDPTVGLRAALYTEIGDFEVLEVGGDVGRNLARCQRFDLGVRQGWARAELGGFVRRGGARHVASGIAAWT
jgi:hypothetical protein